jgi:hypothetical protein
MTAVDIDRMTANWRALCADIGERLAGTAAEGRAAAHVATQLEKAGCSAVHTEEFACRSRKFAEARVLFRIGDRWQPVECAVVTGSSSTDGWVEGAPVWLEMPEQADRIGRRSLEGRIVLLFGPLPTSAQDHRSLVEARPAAVIHVDHRFPFGWAKADGTYPAWVRRYGFPPTITVPYPVAWRWRTADACTLRVRSRIEMVDAVSKNVVGEISGVGPEAEEIIVAAHHDTQAGNVGADDNASGVVGILELAHMLSDSRPRRTIRFISFGTEEQLSVGSAAYVLRHREALDRIGLVVNLDSVASPLGHHGMVCAGGEDLTRYLTRGMKAGGLPVAARRDAMPFADHFPFSAFGVPAVSFLRENFPGGRWQHHSVHDDLANVSAKVLADLVSALAGLLLHAAGVATLPFARGLGEDIAEQTMRFARDLYDLAE